MIAVALRSGIPMWRRVWAMRLIRFAAETLTPAQDTSVRSTVYAMYLVALHDDYRRATK